MLMRVLAGVIVGASAPARLGIIPRGGRASLVMVATPESTNHEERHEALRRPLPSVTTSFAREPTADERRSIEKRQLRHPASDLAAVPAECQCSYGFPQVPSHTWPCMFAVLVTFRAPAVGLGWVGPVQL